MLRKVICLFKATTLHPCHTPGPYPGLYTELLRRAPESIKHPSLFLDSFQEYGPFRLSDTQRATLGDVRCWCAVGSVPSTQTSSLPCCVQGIPPGPVTRGDSRPRLCAWPESLPEAPSRSHSERAQFTAVTGPFLKHYFLLCINESGLSN